ncbi:hypothetical protein ACQPZQ_16080 [Pseudonocardia sp. CA-142604]|uniref:hypothetical protein n=1 Tax=Pseudonocardia sp. CA-142604 TaxID=3240024 RepID=UPI003D8EC67B
MGVPAAGAIQAPENRSGEHGPRWDPARTVKSPLLAGEVLLLDDAAPPAAAGF